LHRGGGERNLAVVGKSVRRDAVDARHGLHAERGEVRRGWETAVGRIGTDPAGTTGRLR
jgi:hypothetical protein